MFALNTTEDSIICFFGLFIFSLLRIRGSVCVEADAPRDYGNKLEALGVGLLMSFLLNLSSLCFSSAHHHNGFEKKNTSRPSGAQFHF